MRNTREALKLAEKQRYAALRNSFATIREFALPSLSPPQMSRLEGIRKYLLKTYKPK